MERIFLKSKIHRAVVTQTEIDYEGSITIDKGLMEAANILSFEKVSVVNINNGERFETYVMPGEKGSGMICLNGAAARKASINDRIIIMSYCNLSEQEIKNNMVNPTIVVVDENNNIKQI
ncbi:MAG: aspartate 1-decarboxylase [Bacteroidetes bacterium]|nr:aspartate 1-decarboxylase [Bacteroidota bacterium]